ncbi:MAG: ABC transporter substrate-binding protein, partial [Gemmobacter sp.]|nr:ABC transporter substrate-binding protein [Gemmobacter sp.]
ASGLILSPLIAMAEGREVQPISFLTWPASNYQHYYETSNYIAESWRELGLDVQLDPQPFPSPMLSMWFTEHKFDVVMSVLSGSPARLDPEFFTVNQFAQINVKPGGANVGGFQSEALEALIPQQRKLYDPEARREVIYEIQKIIYEEQPEGLIASVKNTMAINTDRVKLDDYQPSPDGVRSIWNLLGMQSLDDGAVKLGWTIDQDSWNPLVFKTLEDMDRLALIYDRLVVTGPDGKPRMWAAESIEVVNDTTIEAVLRDGLTFSDGQPVTAEDVAFTFRFLKDKEATYFRSTLTSLADVVADGSRVRFTLTEPSASFVSQALGQVPILPKHIWEPLEAPQDFRNTEAPVGSGPWSLAYWRQGQEIAFTKRDGHFMAPKSDLLMVQFGSAEVLAAALRAGEIGVSLQPIVPTVVAEFAKEPNLRLIQTQSNGHMSARYNIRSEPFSHKAMRQALAHAIPRDQIIEDVLGGDAIAIATPLVPSNGFWSDSGLMVQDYDLDKARAILTEAGFTWDSRGRLRYPE